MNIGIPVERGDAECRVGLTPASVHSLVAQGHAVYVQARAGLGSGFADQDYGDAGAEIVYSAEEVYRRSQLVAKVGPLLLDECPLLDHGEAIMAFQHLAVAPQEALKALRRRALTLIAYELMQDADGSLPVLVPMSQIAGRLAVQVAAHYLEGGNGGKGVLLGGVPGVPPAEVGILGGGVVGSNAARAFQGLGARVTVLDRDLRRLQHVAEVCGGQVSTALATRQTIESLVRRVDVLVGAVLVPGARAPVLVSREMVQQMQPGSVIVDASIDQGGCIETSHPTTHGNPVYVEENVIHYCVPNMPGRVAHTATQALSNVVLPYVIRIAKQGLETALATDPVLAKGVVMYSGHLANPVVAEAFGLGWRELAALL